MIFVTVGTMFPFDRLIAAMDAWAAAHPGEEALAQIGNGRLEPAHMRWVRRLGPAEYGAAIEGAGLIVAHAGIGSVVSAGEHGRPVVLLPRRAGLGEHSNDHQLDTALRLHGRPGVFVAEDETRLAACIEAARAAAGPASVPRAAPPDFLARLRDFVTA